MDVHYANIIAYRVTQNELVLEFGSFFAGQDDNRKEPAYTDFKTRIVLPSEMMDVMIQALSQAKTARDAMRKAGEGQPIFKFNPTQEQKGA